jgi:CHAD domain-containing protein
MADEPFKAGAADHDDDGTPGVFVATYHDTADRRLARAHIALRRRLANGIGLWEAEIGGETVSAPGGPATLPEDLARRLKAVLRNSSLEEVARLRTGTEDVALLEGQHVLRSYDDLVSALRANIRPIRETAPRKRAPAVEHVRRHLRVQLAEIERTDPLIRVGDDPEAIHDFRVAVRRMRSVLKSTKPLFEQDWLESLRDELRWIAGELGDARDLDVLLVELRKDAGPDIAPVVKELETQRRRAWKRARSALESERYGKLLDRIAETVAAPPVSRSDLSLESVAAREFEKLRREAKRLGPKTGAADVHRVRIKAKRARYAAELAASAAGGKRVRRFIEASKKFQDVVGAHQDAVVAEERVQSLIDHTKSTRTSFAAGRLVERSAAGRRRLARKKFRSSWHELERRGRKAWA